MSESTVTCTATEYVVSALPLGHPDWHIFGIVLVYRGPAEVGGDADRWTVARRGNVLTADGSWVPMSLARDDESLVTRFPLAQAEALAREWAPRVTVNGWTAKRVMEGTQ